MAQVLRKDILKWATLSPIVLWTAACNVVPTPSPGPNPTPVPLTPLQQAQDIAKTVGAALSTILTLLPSLNALSGSTAQRYQNDVNQVSTVINDILGAASQAQAGSFASQFAAGVSAAVADLASASNLLPANIVTALQNISAVMPVFMTIFNLVVGHRMMAVGAAIDPNRALQDLKNFSGLK